MIHFPVPPPPIDGVVASYSFKKTSSEEEDDDEEEEEEMEKKEKKKRRRVGGGLIHGAELDDTPSGLKRVGALLLTLLIVVAVVGVIGYFVWKQNHERVVHKLQMLNSNLWTEPHATASALVDPHAHWFKNFLNNLELDLGSRLRHHDCLCMHHLKYSSISTLYQACVIAEPALAYATVLLVNPQLKGRGNETDDYTEHSVSCTSSSQRKKRFRTIFLEWFDLQTTQTVWARFDGPVAACLQLALDEMLLGNKHCE